MKHKNILYYYLLGFISTSNFASTKILIVSLLRVGVCIG